MLFLCSDFVKSGTIWGLYLCFILNLINNNPPIKAGRRKGCHASFWRLPFILRQGHPLSENPLQTAIYKLRPRAIAHTSMSSIARVTKLGIVLAAAFSMFGLRVSLKIWREFLGGEILAHSGVVDFRYMFLYEYSDPRIELGIHQHGEFVGEMALKESCLHNSVVICHARKLNRSLHRADNVSNWIYFKHRSD